MTDFTLDERLARDSLLVCEGPLSQVRLMDEARYPWLLLVPRRPGIREIHELTEADQQQLGRESARLGRWLMETFQGHKLNVAAIGNMVPQLHVHHIVRYENDAAWPHPVWGRFPREPYGEADRQRLLERLKALEPVINAA